MLSLNFTQKTSTLTFHHLIPFFGPSSTIRWCKAILVEARVINNRHYIYLIHFWFGTIFTPDALSRSILPFVQAWDWHKVCNSSSSLHGGLPSFSECILNIFKYMHHIWIYTRHCYFFFPVRTKIELDLLHTPKNEPVVEKKKSQIQLQRIIIKEREII